MRMKLRKKLRVFGPCHPHMIPHPKRRSSRWISTCFEEENLALPTAQTASTEYFLSNSNNPVLFHQAVLQIPRGAIVLEIGSRALLSSVVKRTMENQLTSLSLMKQDHNDNIGFCLSNLGKYVSFQIMKVA